jgi:hypothetical protein
MKLKTLVVEIILLTFFSTSSFAIEFDAPIPAKVFLQPKTIRATTAASQPSPTKTVYLMNFKLTPAQYSQFTTFQPLNSKLTQSSTVLPSKVDVGMNNTPVLDQGQHGSCVTFAITGAIDALLRKGDYVSQLCSLAVGSYMEKYGYYPSGWDGSVGGMVINQLLQLGIVKKSKQKENTCGGLREYPVNSINNSTPMPLEEYNALSENLTDHILYRPIITLYDRFVWGKDMPKQSAAILQQVKESLANKLDPSDPNSARRLTLAVMLPVNHCSSGACGSYHARFDTWALTDAIKNDQDGAFGGHEMIITGYDDDAVVYDNAGKAHKGLLTLRNSWGADAGDKGNYYMSYEFFRQFLVEVHELMWGKFTG